MATDSVKDLQRLNQIALILNQAVDVQTALNASLAELVDLMGLETGWIFLRDEHATGRWHGRGFRLAAHVNLPPALALDNHRAWDKSCSCQDACERGVLDAAYNEIHCSRLAESGGDGRNLIVHASTPLLAAERVLGIVNVAAADWAAFDDRALTLLSTVGNQMGVALERASLYDMLQERRIHEQAALLELSRQLLRQPDLDTLTAFIVEEARRLVNADAGALLLPEINDPSWLRFRAAVSWKSDPVGNGYRVPAELRSHSGRVMLSQRPVVIPDITHYGQELWMLDWLQVEGFRAEAIVPLIADGRSIGTLVVSSREPRPFDETELRLLQLMANHAAIAIEQARLRNAEMRRRRLEEELAVGRQIQLSMLPEHCPSVPGWRFAADYQAAREVGGDFYDFFELPAVPGTWGIVIADVSDKGVPAALFMALSRTAIRNTAMPSHPPHMALIRANRYIREDSQSDMFLTAFYGTLNTADGRFRFSNAGHNPPFWWRDERQELRELSTPGIALGVLDEIKLKQGKIRVRPGDALVLYTDGVTEAINPAGEEFGKERLRSTLLALMADTSTCRADRILAGVLTAVAEFVGDVSQHDDTTICVITRDLPPTDVAAAQEVIC